MRPLKAKRRRDNPEYHLHCAIADYLRAVLTDETIFWHTPNGGYRHLVEAMKLQRMGTFAGLPDLTLVHDGRAYFIEVKAGKGRLSPAQVKMCLMLEAVCCPTAVARSIDDVAIVLDRWRIPTREARAAA